MTAGLPKEERLSGKKAIGTLMDGGRWGHTTHLRYCCLEDNGLEFSRLMVSVPKRSFKRAVKRNLLKRRIREAYRTRKTLLCDGHGVDLLIVYSGTDVLDYSVIVEEMVTILTKISAR